MHLQLRTICFLSIFIFLLDWTAKNVRLADPATPEEGAKQGVVAFGVFSFRQEQIEENQDKSQPVYRKIDGVNFIGITSINDQNKTVQTIPFNLKETMISKTDSKELYKSNYIVRNNYHSVILDETDKMVAIESLTYKFDKIKNICQINVYESLKLLPIKMNPGEINFLGIYLDRGKTISKDEEDSDCFLI